jgi:hypothetical protein
MNLIPLIGTRFPIRLKISSPIWCAAIQTADLVVNRHWHIHGKMHSIYSNPLWFQDQWKHSRHKGYSQLRGYSSQEINGEEEVAEGFQCYCSDSSVANAPTQLRSYCARKKRCCSTPSPVNQNHSSPFVLISRFNRTFPIVYFWNII